MHKFKMASSDANSLATIQSISLTTKYCLNAYNNWYLQGYTCQKAPNYLIHRSEI